MAPRHDRTGRDRGEGRFIGLPWHVFDSAGFRATPVMARAVLLELARRYNGRNNGAIAFSIRQIAEACHCSHATASRALQALEDAGLVTVMERGHFARGDRKASVFRLAWRPCDVTGALPARRYLEGPPTGHDTARPARKGAKN